MAMWNCGKWAVLAACLGLSAITAPASAEPVAPEPVASEPAARFSAWVARSGDNNGAPFAIVDKQAALVLVYAADGSLLGAEPALLGSARGDESVPGIGERPLSSITEEERTTPAGRFIANFGPAQGLGGWVLWVDFDSAVALHPVVTANQAEQRAERLDSATPDDNRITYGCINVSAEFYETVVQPAFKDTLVVFYVLPEALPMEAVFPGLTLQASLDAAGS